MPMFAGYLEHSEATFSLFSLDERKQVIFVLRDCSVVPLDVQLETDRQKTLTLLLEHYLNSNNSISRRRKLHPTLCSKFYVMPE